MTIEMKITERVALKIRRKFEILNYKKKNPVITTYVLSAKNTPSGNYSPYQSGIKKDTKPILSAEQNEIYKGLYVFSSKNARCSRLKRGLFCRNRMVLKSLGTKKQKIVSHDNQGKSQSMS